MGEGVWGRPELWAAQIGTVMEKQEGWVETVLGHFCFLSASLVLALGLQTLVMGDPRAPSLPPACSQQRGGSCHLGAGCGLLPCPPPSPPDPLKTGVWPGKWALWA